MSLLLKVIGGHIRSGFCHPLLEKKQIKDTKYKKVRSAWERMNVMLANSGKETMTTVL